MVDQETDQTYMDAAFVAVHNSPVHVVLVSLLVNQLSSLAASMYFWSVSWSTNCPVYFSFFLVDQKWIWSTKNMRK